MRVCGPVNEVLWAQEDVTNVPSELARAGGDQNKQYFLIGGGADIKTPEERFNLVLVLPGGDGSGDFNPFVRRIWKNALSEKYIIAQLVAVQWNEQQRVVWPVRGSKVQGQKFTTEQFAEAVIRDVKEKYKVNDACIFTLSWSSGGPAAYAISMYGRTSVMGSYVAMSVFRPDEYNLARAKGHAYFIDHSPDDTVCPFRMAEEARDVLSERGAKVKMVAYDGGHGWRGNVYGRLREGFAWLEENTGMSVDQTSADTEPDGKPERVRQKPVKVEATLPFEDGFEDGVNRLGGWRKGADVRRVRYIWDRQVAYEGRASLCLKKTEDRYFPIAQWHKQFAYGGKGKKLEIAAMVKAEEVTKAIIDVQFIGEGDAAIGHEWAAYIGAKEAGDAPVSHDWKEYSGTVAIPAGTKAIMIGLQIYGPGAVWFDALSAEYVEE
jgi:predicted esterase